MSTKPQCVRLPVLLYENPRAGGPPVVLKDRETGRIVRPLVIDEETGEHLDVRTVRIGRAPTAL